MACSGTRERDLARKYNLKCLRVNITRISKEQLDFYQINLEKCTQQVLQFEEVKLEPSESFWYTKNSETAEVKLEESESCSETAVKCLIKRETSDLRSNLHHAAAMDHLQDDLENALTSELIIKSEECSNEGYELLHNDNSCIRQNLEAESVSPGQAEDGLQDELFIKSELECSEGKVTQESAGSEGGNLCQDVTSSQLSQLYLHSNVSDPPLPIATSVWPSNMEQTNSWYNCTAMETSAPTSHFVSTQQNSILRTILSRQDQSWRRTAHQTKVYGACYQQVCHQIDTKLKKNIHVKESSKQKEMQSERDLNDVTSLSQTDADKFDKDNESLKVVQGTSEQTKVQSYSCVCDKTLSSMSHLYRHMRGVHKEVYSFICNLCPKSFTSKVNLKQHLRFHSNDRPFKCDKCAKCFKYKNILTTHNKHVHSDVRAFACEKCGKTYKSKAHVKSHMNVHAVELNFTCGDCGKKFKTKKLLSQHIKTHSTVRAYQCGQCGKRFKIRSHLSRHIISVHSDVRPFSCDICAKSFKSKRALKRHSVVHSTSYDFTCNLCPAKFKFKPNLLTHMKTVHSDARPFKCYDCGCSFKLKSCLIRHMATHLNLRQFQCKKCDKKFNDKSNLLKHNLMHSKTSAFP